MPRPSNAEIDSEILESAAGLIAGRGIDGASLAQIASAVGYSKAGLLHHFPSKQALVDAVLAAASDMVAGIVHSVEDLPVGPKRDVAVVTGLARFAIAQPGHISLVLATFTGRSTAVKLNPVLAGIAAGLRTAFDGTADPDTERFARTIAALASIALLSPHAARHAADTGTTAAKALLVTIALDALGVPASDR